MEKKVNDKKKVLIYCLLSGLAALIIFCLYSALAHVAPFGNITVSRNDAITQYIPFLTDYINNIKSGNFAFWSWKLGGVNQLALSAYYILSPFNMLALPFGTKNMEVAFWLIIAVKTFCMATAFSYFAQKKFRESNLLTIAFSLIYTFGGFYLSYYYNTMWLDALITLPLIALGIENIVNGKKATLYTIALTYTIFVNFYTGYMICIFSVLYFFYLLFARDISRNKEEKDKTEQPIMPVMIKYGVASLLSGLLCAVVIIPVFFGIHNAAAKSDFDSTEPFFNILDFLSYHLSGMQVFSMEATKATAPYVLSSMLTFVALPLFFFSKKIKPNKKVVSLMVIALLAASFMVPKMNYLWHGFAAPTFLPYRFSFIYIFFIIMLAYEAVKDIKEVPAWAFGISLALTVVALVYTKFSQFSDHFTSRAIILSSVVTVLYLVILLLKKYDKLNKKAINAMLCVVLAAELIAGNTHIMRGGTRSVGEAYPNIDSMKEVTEYVKSIGGEGALNRMEILEDNGVQPYYSSTNSPSTYDYNGVTQFSSMNDQQYAIVQKTMGLGGFYGVSNKYAPETPIYNATFAIEYIYDTVNNIGEDNPYYEKVKDFSNGTLYKVKYSLPIGYMVDKGVDNWDPYNYIPRNVQNTLWQTLFNNKDAVMDNGCLTAVYYNKCVPVSAEEISKYIVDNADKIADKKAEFSDDHSSKDHAHTHEEEAVAVDENAVTMNFSAENLNQILDMVGDVYSYRATEDGYNLIFNYEVKNDGEFFATVNTGVMKLLTLTRTDGSTKDFHVEEKAITDLGFFKAGDSFTLTVHEPDRSIEELEEQYKNYDGYPLTDSIQMSVASVNDELFQKGYKQILEDGTLQNIVIDNNYVEGTVNAQKDGYMMMAMPYDLGWTVYVDGEPIELHEHDSHIMMFELSKGQHTIQMQYFPQGLKEGLFVSVASILALVMFLLLNKVHKMKLEFIKEEEAKAAEKENTEPKTKE